MKDPSSSVRKEGPPSEQAAEGYGQSPSGKGKKTPCTGLCALHSHDFSLLHRRRSTTTDPAPSELPAMYLFRPDVPGPMPSCRGRAELQVPGLALYVHPSLALLGDTGLAQQLGPDLPKESQGPAEEDGVSRP